MQPAVLSEMIMCFYREPESDITENSKKHLAGNTERLFLYCMSVFTVEVIFKNESSNSLFSMHTFL